MFSVWEPDRGLMKGDTETLRQQTLLEDVFFFFCFNLLSWKQIEFF